MIEILCPSCNRPMEFMWRVKEGKLYRCNRHVDFRKDEGKVEWRVLFPCGGQADFWETVERKVFGYG